VTPVFAVRNADFGGRAPVFGPGPEHLLLYRYPDANNAISSYGTPGIITHTSDLR